MENISIRLDKEMIEELEVLMKRNRFATLTEFVRSAIRDKMKELEHEELQMQIKRLAGSSKRKTTDEDLHKAREKAVDELEKKFKLRNQ